MQDLLSENFDPVQYINEQIGVNEEENQIDDALNDLIMNLKIKEKKYELIGEQSMNFVNDNLEEFWDMLEETKIDLAALEDQMNVGEGTGDQNKDSKSEQIDKKLMENMMGLSVINARNSDILSSLESKNSSLERYFMLEMM